MARQPARFDLAGCLEDNRGRGKSQDRDGHFDASFIRERADQRVRGSDNDYDAARRGKQPIKTTQAIT